MSSPNITITFGFDGAPRIVEAKNKTAKDRVAEARAKADKPPSKVFDPAGEVTDENDRGDDPNAY
jgi:vacuolar-type H+-ATPase subunit H